MADAKKVKKEEKKQEPSKRSLYKVENNRVVRSRTPCPKCGPGVFLAQHADRVSCGRCGHTEFKKKEAPVAKTA